MFAEGGTGGGGGRGEVSAQGLGFKVEGLGF